MLKTSARRILVLAVLAALVTLPGISQPRPNPTLDAAKKQAIVDEVSKLMNEIYVYPDTAKKIEEKLRSRLAGGEYDKLTGAREFATAVSRDILDVSKDRHTGFAYDPELTAGIRQRMSQNPDEVRKAQERRLAGARHNNFNFRKAERLDGNIGYLNFLGFIPAEVGGSTAIAALNFLAYCDALIIDLRQNGGGDPTMIQLISSYFFGEPVHLNDIYTRATDSTEHFWTLPYVPGPKMESVALFILTSANTFSAAEEFCYNLKNLKRATLVGETTGGGAHPTEQKIVQEDFVLRVPYARSINPISKTNWEGTGVTPDVPVPAAQAFDKAYSLALDKLSSKTADPQRKAELDWVIISQRAKLNPVHLTEKTLKAYAGEFEERKVTFENGALMYQRSGPKLRLTPLTETVFAVEGIDYFRVEFVIKDGKVTGIVGVYDNGEREPSARTK